ncbi:MAG TPA: hypothetical protein VGN72_18870 [Tepidisphaeraceae bacterium]|nr:hypothetical protein [Tepidisphaeraceae bacterium]
MKRASDNLLPASIAGYLTALAARQRKLSLLRATGRALAILVLFGLTSCLVDRLLRLPGGIRLALLLVNIAFAATVFLPVLWRWARGRTDYEATSELAERCDPRWQQRLSTVTSRLLGPQAYHGSVAMLQQVVESTTAQAKDADPRPLLPLRLIARPWVLLGIACITVLACLPIRWLNLPQLAARAALPLADIAPVTTTRLNVMPGAAQVQQGQSLSVLVTADRLGSDVPRLHVVSAGGQVGSQHAMVQTERGFVHRFDTLSSDVRYFVTGGDAVTPTYDVQVLRRPLITDFRIRYVYPEYTKRPPLIVSNRTGLIEAPAGTQATVTIAATEPLLAAALQVGDKQLQLARTLETNVRQVTLPVLKDASYSVALTSERGATNELGKYAIRALPDRPPLVRVFDSGEGPRPGPRDLMPLSYQAFDDYGVSELAALVKVNGVASLRIGLKVIGDPRQQEQTYPLDLAALNVNVGDVIAVTVQARDGRSQTAESSPVTALVSPRSMDMNAHQRVVELSAARTVAEGLLKAWATTAEAFEALAKQPARGGAYLSAVAEANRAVARVGESAAVLRQSLLRATLRSRSHEMSVALAAALDVAQQQLLASERLIGIRSDREGARSQIDESVKRARELRDMLATLAIGERAIAALAERENVAAATTRAAVPDYPEVLKAGIKRLSEDFAQSLKQLEINPGAGDVAEQLQRRVEAADRVMQSEQLPDFAKAADAWAVEIAKPHKRTGFDDRLTMAAQAESIRPDADLVRARDVHVAAEAASRIETNRVAPTTRPTDPLPRELYPASMLALQRYHETNRPMKDRPSSDEVADRQRVANEGRRRMFAWAGLEQVDVSVQPEQESIEASPETLAIEANAAAATRDYATAAHIDRALARSTTQSAAPEANGGDEMPLPRAARTMAAAERIDHLAAQQQALAEETRLAPPNGAGELATKQETLTDAIGEVHADTRLDLRNADDPDWREEAIAAIQAAQEQLAAMPQALSQVARADGIRRDAAVRLDRAKQSADATPADQLPAAQRVIAQADRDLAEAVTRTNAAAVPVRPQVAEGMSADLSNYRPPTRRGVEAIDRALLPALRAYAQSVGVDDANELERAAGKTRQAIEQVQAELLAAQDELIERDPLVAARWFSRAAVRSLKMRPPDLLAAERQQRVASAALTRAWDRSIHQAAGERMATVPSMMSVFNLFPVNADGGAGDGEAAERIMSLVPNLRQWGRMRVGTKPETSAVRRDSDPVGFEEPVRLYFETLGKAGDGGTK